MTKKKLITFLNKNNKYIALFAGIIIFRLIYGYFFFSFGQDIARDLILMGNKMADHQLLVGYGPKASVWDFYLPPLYYQLHLIVSWITNNCPVAMKFLTTFVESFTPLVLFFILKLYTKKSSSAIFATLYAFSHLVVIFAIKEWNPNMIPFFSTLALFSWLNYLKNKNPAWIPVGVISVAVTVQLHYQSVVIVPFLLIVMIYSLIKRTKDYKYWIAGIIIGLLTYAPYIFAEMQNNWHNTFEIYNYFTLEHANYYESVSKPAFLISFIPGFIERILFNIHYNYWIGRIILFGGFFFLGLRTLKNKHGERWLVLYFLLILCMLRVYKGIKLDYYMSTLYIMPAVLLAFMWDKIKWLTMPFLALITFIIVKNYTTVPTFDQYHDLYQSIQKLNTAVGDQGVRFIFNNDDRVNTMTYGIQNFATFHIDNTSSTIIQICEKGGCEQQQILQCRNNRGQTLASYLTSLPDETYQQQIVRGNQDSFTITTFDQTPPDVHYSQVANIDVYGSDILMPELVQW